MTGAGGGEQIRTIHEELPGFDAAMASFEIQPDFERKWHDAVILPPFGANRTVIYSPLPAPELLKYSHTDPQN